MKKIILLSLLLTSLYADPKIYMGAGIGYFNENFTDKLDAEISTMMSTFKIGYGEQKAYAVEFSIDWVDNKSKIFSQNDGDKYSINVEFVKAFNLYKYVNPFFKAGFGAGRMEIDRELQDTLNFGSFNIGTGIFIPINEHFDFEIGYNYRFLTYEKLDIVVDDISYESHVNTIYTSLNIRF